MPQCQCIQIDNLLGEPPHQNLWLSILVDSVDDMLLPNGQAIASSMSCFQSLKKHCAAFNPQSSVVYSTQFPCQLVVVSIRASSCPRSPCDSTTPGSYLTSCDTHRLTTSKLFRIFFAMIAAGHPLQDELTRSKNIVDYV